jgi:hypothetical protein
VNPRRAATLQDGCGTYRGGPGFGLPGRRLVDEFAIISEQGKDAR